MQKTRGAGGALETRTAAGKVGQVTTNTQRLTLPGRFHPVGVGGGVPLLESGLSETTGMTRLLDQGRGERSASDYRSERAVVS